MDHLAGYLLWSILALAVLRLGTGALLGWLAARHLAPFGTRGGHMLAGMAGAVIVPVLAEKIFGAPLSMINAAMASGSGMAVLIAYIIGFSAICAAGAIWLYRNIRLARREG